MTPLESLFRVDGAHALVIGASKGIGRAAMLALAEAGAKIYAVARSSDDLHEACANVRQRGGDATAIVADITDKGDREQVFSALSRVDILVNSAGANIPEPLLQVCEEHLDTLLNLNVRAAFLVAQAAAQKMVGQGEGGVIINISSQMGHVGATNRTVYCMTKHALEGLTKAMAIELAPHQIRVNSVAPTFIETAMTKPFLSDGKFREWVLARLPLGRLGTEADVAGAIIFLASGASSMITGASLLVDGGWTAQ
jgi:NAD(P)-dependent dehydrogenase (short-subunit alcohol dehydrogenase family)